MGITRYTLGVDPGTKGGLVLFKNETIVYMHLFKKIGDQPDIYSLEKVLRKIRKKENLIVYVERFTGFFGIGKHAFGKLNKHLGNIEGLLVGLRMKHQFVTPGQWQKVSWSGVNKIMVKKKGNKKKSTDSKATSLKAARMLFPKRSFIPKGKRVPQDGLVDAALIGWYGVQTRNTSS